MYNIYIHICRQTQRTISIHQERDQNIQPLVLVRRKHGMEVEGSFDEGFNAYASVSRLSLKRHCRSAAIVPQIFPFN